MDFAKDKINQVSENLKGAGSKASAEQDKGEPPLHLPFSAPPGLILCLQEVAKGNTNAGVGAQATAAKDYVADKSDQKKHEV